MYSIGEYVKPSSLTEAIALLEGQPGAVPLAGGTDIIRSLSNGRAVARVLIDLKRIPGLSGIEGTYSRFSIGAMTTIHEICTSPLVKKAFPLLSEAGMWLGSWQVRNRATTGGNLCNASPAAELACPLLVYDAEVTLEGPAGLRVMPLTGFFTGPGQTARRHSEILTSITCRRPGGAEAGHAGAYERLGPRSAMDISIVNVAVNLGFEGVSCIGARVALGAVGPVPFRVPEAEALLLGHNLDPRLIRQVSLVAQKAARPITDIRASAAYRSDMVRALVDRALSRVLKKVSRCE